jgi:hydroxyethylthiazole kinase-like uncharacterized protein yjeF
MTLDALPRIAARQIPTATAAEMAEADRFASEVLGIPLEALMESAARQIAAAARAFLGELEGQIVAAVVGTGNNGGDALAALRHLLGWGAEVDAFVAGPPDGLQPLARRQYDILKKLGVPLYDTTTLDDRFLVHRLRGRNLILDGLLGYSTRGAPRGEIARLIAVATAASAGGTLPILAVDLPSGIHPDTGEPLDPARHGAIAAALTVTLALPKTGLLRDAARGCVGELLLADIGIPAKAYEAIGLDAPSVFAAGDLLRIVS